MTSLAKKVDEYESFKVPESLYINRRYNGQLWLAGVGPRTAKVMFVTPVITKEDAAEEVQYGSGYTTKRDPKIGECGQWQILRKIALMEGLDLDQCFLTSIVKFFPKETAQQTKPKVSLMRKVLPCLEHEINEIKPSIIVCVGKLAWDMLSEERASESDIYGLWLHSKKYNCKIYAIPHLSKTLKPELHERFKLDMRAIKQMLDCGGTESSENKDWSYEVIRNSIDLRSLVTKLELLDAKVLSVDCEWGGQIHTDGLLRSLQIAWSPSEAAYIRFRDEDANYVFDVDYAAAGAILAEWCNREDVKYIGHHISADLPWMHHWLGLDWRGKAIFDSEFALQCCDESMDLGLDVLALRYTNFGKYDWDLIKYRKTHPERKGTGYELVPDAILIPYGCLDVLTVYRAWEPICKWLERQKLTKYYNEILNPFVTDVFTFFCLKGIPVDRKKIDDMREFYTWARDELQKEFSSTIVQEADELLHKKLKELAPDKADEIFAKAKQFGLEGKAEEGSTFVLKSLNNPAATASILPTLNHWKIAPVFNHQSAMQLQKWLFDVKGYTPIKSTANKDAGMPSVAWDKVLTYPPEKQASFTPAADQGTLEILASRNNDEVLKQLLEVKKACSVCRSFLRPAELDDEGNVVKEQGLHYWIASDDAIHLNHSTTETGRARS